MVLYELIGIVRSGALNRTGNIAEVKEIARTAGSTILEGGGVVRGYTNWGVMLLPKPISKHQVKHHVGHHFVMRFDASARTQESMQRTLDLDPRVIRHSLVKLGSKLSEIKDVPGRAEWGEPFGQNRDHEYEQRLDGLRKEAKRMQERVTGQTMEEMQMARDRHKFASQRYNLKTEIRRV